MSFFSTSFSAFEKQQALKEVSELGRLGYEALIDGKFATAEKLFERASQTAERLGPEHLLSFSLIYTKFHLATALRMQSKWQEALVIYTWLIALSTDPSYSSAISSNEKSLWYLARAYMDFIECAQNLLEIKLEKLITVVDDGLIWLEQIRKSSEWSSGLRLQRGLLYKKQEKYEEARLELEAAFALHKRYPHFLCYSSASYRQQLSELLWNKPFEEWERAADLASEVLSPDFKTNNYGKFWGYQNLGWCRLKQGRLAEAELAARESLRFAHLLENSMGICSVFHLQALIYAELGNFEQAIVAAVAAWKCARKGRSVSKYYYSLEACIKVKLAQAKEIVIPLQKSSSQITTLATLALLHRKINSSRKFLKWATEEALKLDGATGSRYYQRELDEYIEELHQLEVLLSQHISQNQ